MELFAAVILSHVQSSSCVQKPPPRQLIAARPVVGLLIISALVDTPETSRSHLLVPLALIAGAAVSYGRGDDLTPSRAFFPTGTQRSQHSSAGKRRPQMWRDKGTVRQFKYLFTMKMARTLPRRRPVHMSYVPAEIDRYNCMHMQTCSLSLI